MKPVGHCVILHLGHVIILYIHGVCVTDTTGYNAEHSHSLGVQTVLPFALDW